VPVVTARWPTPHAVNGDATAATGGAGSTMYSVFVHVPNSQMVIELMSNTSALLVKRTDLITLEPRLSTTRLNDLLARAPLRRGVLQPVRVSRAATNLTALDAFYVDAMRTQQTLVIERPDVGVRCYEWPGANADVCFVRRPESASTGSFSVADFETMLHTVAQTVVTTPLCNMNRWADNHYALDLFGTEGEFDYIVDYLDATPTSRFQCATFGPQPSSGPAVHYLYDPTGWAVQLNMEFTKSPKRCVTQAAAAKLRTASSNPMCSGGSC